MKKKKVVFSNPSNIWHGAIYLPLSSGYLAAYAKKNPVLENAYEFKQFILHRRPIEEVVNELSHPSIFAASCYVWNTKYNLALAAEIKSKYPDCLVIFGGPQVPDDGLAFLKKHPHVDILIHKEGEVTFEQVLLECLKEEPHFENISGLTFKQLDRVLKTGPRERIKDLDDIPSPYLTGIFDGLIETYKDYEIHVLQETTRGCPYACTFCDWGSATYTKLRQFNIDRIYQEIEWFASRQISYLYNADANFGISPRDLDIANKIFELKQKSPKFTSFATNFAKNSDDRVLEISKILYAAGVHRGTQLSLQSVNKDTLKSIKRMNSTLSRYGHILKIYREAGVPVFTEILLGLPDETYETFISGLFFIIENGNHDMMSYYEVSLIMNAELNSEEMIKKYQIESIEIDFNSSNSTAPENIVLETDKYIVSTSTMNKKMYVDAWLFGWMIQVFHYFGATQYLSRAFNDCMGISYRTFYTELFQYIKNSDGLINREYLNAKSQIEKFIKGEAHVTYVRAEVDDLVRYPTQFAIAQYLSNKELFYSEIFQFSKQLPHFEDELFSELIHFQKTSVVDPLTVFPIEAEFGFSFHTALDEKKISRKKTRVKFENNSFGGDLSFFLNYTTWWNLRRRPFINKISEVNFEKVEVPAHAY